MMIIKILLEHMIMDILKYLFMEVLGVQHQKANDALEIDKLIPHFI